MDSVLLIAALAKIVFVLIIIFTFAPVLIWAERRQSAMIQDRIGPVRAGVDILGTRITLLGLLHPLADAIKFLWKEDFIPPKADKFLHAMAPVIALIPAIATFAVIPFGDTLYLEYTGTTWDELMKVLPAEGGIGGRAIPLQIASLNIGILFIFAVAGTGVVGAAVAGYCSDNKFALLGGLRAAGQMVSYEVSLGLSLVACFMTYGSLEIGQMVQWQIHHEPIFGFLPAWGIFVQPLAFILFFTGAIAETKRIPFDLPEGESELASGYFMEYSGMKFGMFFMGEFIEVVATSALLVAIFFGGYDMPFLDRQGLIFFGERIADLPHTVVVALNVLNFVIKTVVIIWLQLMIRWSLPRFRYDQMMKLCWQGILPLSLANIFVTGIVILLLQE